MNHVKLWTEKYLPLLAKAKEQGEHERVFSWLDESNSICGVQVTHLTPQIIIRLEAVGNNFFTGGEIDIDDVLQFLWSVSKDYQNDRNGGEKFFKKWGNKLELKELTKEIFEYLRNSFLEKDLGEAKKSNVEKQVDLYKSTWIAQIIDILASEYGWSRTEILNTPIAQILQLIKAINERVNPKGVKFDSDISRLQSEFLKECQEIANREKKENGK